MAPYADTSFLARIYAPHADSAQALVLMQRLRVPVPFTPLHRHEFRTAIRLRVFRGEITAEQRKEAFRELESDLRDQILVHTAVPWTDAFQEAENLSAIYTESLGVRSSDLLHVALARVLNATEFLTFDLRQAALANVAGLKVRPVRA